MEQSDPKTKPGWKTTEFWLTCVGVLAGLIMSSGLADNHPLVKVAGMAMAALTALGYSVSRGITKKAMVLVLVIFIPLSISGCSKGMVRVEAIAGLVEDVSRRHDSMLKGEVKPESVSEADRATWLRSTEILRGVVREARAP